MGVLACSRNGCENIMCDYYAYLYGYICNECLEELKNGKERSIETFMNSLKCLECFDDSKGWQEFVDSVFTSG